MQKKCRRCNQLKDYTHFSRAEKNKDGYANTCKPCVSLRNRDYWRTPTGRMSFIYNTQKYNSRVRGHPAPAYTQHELTDWAFKQGLQRLVTEWAAAGYPKDLAPSVDRLDDSKGYHLDNIRLVTWTENNNKMYVNRKSCSRVTIQNQQIQQLSFEGHLINTYDSIAHASRLTGITRTNINNVCKKNGTRKSAGGYIWRYAD